MKQTLAGKHVLLSHPGSHFRKPQFMLFIFAMRHFLHKSSSRPSSVVLQLISLANESSYLAKGEKNHNSRHPHSNSIVAVKASDKIKQYYGFDWSFLFFSQVQSLCALRTLWLDIPAARLDGRL